MVMASVRADFVTRGPGQSKSNPTITVHGRMSHEIGALCPAFGGTPRFASLYIHDTEQASSSRKNFYGELHKSFLYQLAEILEHNNNLVKIFVSLRLLMHSNNVTEDVQLVIHAHGRNQPGHMRKCNIPVASEVVALIVGEQHGKLDNV